jgi:hypothetical protein
MLLLQTSQQIYGRSIDSNYLKVAKIGESIKCQTAYEQLYPKSMEMEGGFKGGEYVL